MRSTVPSTATSRIRVRPLSLAVGAEVACGDVCGRDDTSLIESVHQSNRLIHL